MAGTPLPPGGDPHPLQTRTSIGNSILDVWPDPEVREDPLTRPSVSRSDRSSIRGIVHTNNGAIQQEERWRKMSVRQLSMPVAYPNNDASAEQPFIQEPRPLTPVNESRRRIALQRRNHSRIDAWDGMATVEVHGEVEIMEEEKRHRDANGKHKVCFMRLQSWVLATIIGIGSSLTGLCVEFMVERLAKFRLMQFEFLSGYHHFLLIWAVAVGALYAFTSACMVKYLAPAAAGSGIPETKTILNGFVMPNVVSVRTLLVKAPGLALSVSAGMALGKEGPLVHVAMCWAQLVSRFSVQFRNDSRKCELFSAAAAAGVSTAFGAPLGGVLFSLEEVSSFFPPRTLIRAFIAAIAAAATLLAIRGKKLTMFSVGYDSPVQLGEYVPIILLGVMGGLIGAFFNAVNVRWSAVRMTPRFRKYIGPVTEVTCIAIVTAATSHPLKFTRYLSTEVIHALFSPCSNSSNFDLCEPDGQLDVSSTIIFQLLLASLLRLLQMTLTFGTQVPAGLFVPSLFTGACLGRAVGLFVQATGIFPDVQAGVYSMIGAAAVLGGVCRVTISLVAIMAELTGSMTYMVPFMVSVLVAKIVGDLFTLGIYDLYIMLKGYPFLRTDENITFSERCCDIMETRLVTLDQGLRPRYIDIRMLLDEYPNWEGFPVVNDGQFVGFARGSKLQEMLQRMPDFATTDDLVTDEDIELATDSAVMRMVPTASLAQAHNVFAQLGVRHIFLVGSSADKPGQDVLHGMLTRKNFLRALQSGEVGHMQGSLSSKGEEEELNSRRSSLNAARQMVQYGSGVFGESSPST